MKIFNILTIFKTFIFKGCIALQYICGISLLFYNELSLRVSVVPNTFLNAILEDSSMLLLCQHIGVYPSEINILILFYLSIITTLLSTGYIFSKLMKPIIMTIGGIAFRLCYGIISYETIIKVFCFELKKTESWDVPTIIMPFNINIDAYTLVHLTGLGLMIGGFMYLQNRLTAIQNEFNAQFEEAGDLKKQMSDNMKKSYEEDIKPLGENTKTLIEKVTSINDKLIETNENLKKESELQKKMSENLEQEQVILSNLEQKVKRLEDITEKSINIHRYTLESLTTLTMANDRNAAGVTAFKGQEIYDGLVKIHATNSVKAAIVETLL